MAELKAISLGALISPCLPFPVTSYQQLKLIDSLEQEKMAAVTQLEEELVVEACRELEVHSQRQAR